MTSPGVLDTSIFVAMEAGRRLAVDKLPELAVISVITLAELHAGVLAATDTATRASRLTALEAVAEIEHLPVDARAATAWAAMRVRLAEAGRRINVNDLWIAATAVAHGLTVFTQDADYSVLSGLGGPEVVVV